MSEAQYPHEVDTKVSARQIDEHHKKCPSCRLLYATAKQMTDRPSVYDVWRREFWRCFRQMRAAARL